jgi:hypothetical protein
MDMCLIIPLSPQTQKTRLDFVDSVMSKQAWADNFLKQWEYLNIAAQEFNCQDKIHIWVDKELKSFTNPKDIEYWLYRPTVEQWPKKRSIIQVANRLILAPN